MGDQLLLGNLVEVMDVYWKSGSYPEYVATFTQAGPTATELNPAAKLAKASANSWRISWLQANPKGAGSKSRARYECYKGPLPSQLRYLLAADKMTFVGISTMAS